MDIFNPFRYSEEKHSSLLFSIANASCSISSTHEALRELETTSADYIVTKTCTLNPVTRGSKPTVYESPNSTSVNRIGLINPGYEYWRTYVSECKPYIISVTGTLNQVREILKLPTTATGFEFNISCPNKDTPLSLDSLFRLQHKLSYGIKLPPYLRDEEMNEVAKLLTLLNGQTPLEYIVCCNALPNGVVNNRVGAVGGLALKPISLYNVRTFRRLLPTDIRVYGCGGIFTGEDARDYLQQGANGVQVGTCLINNGVGELDSIRDKMFQGRSNL